MKIGAGMGESAAGVAVGSAEEICASACASTCASIVAGWAGVGWATIVAGTGNAGRRLKMIGGLSRVLLYSEVYVGLWNEWTDAGSNNERVVIDLKIHGLMM